MKFNLQNTSGSASNKLRAWTINEVTFEGIEAKDGTTKDGRTWKAFQVKFNGPDGSYEQMFFCPGPDGDKRRSGETGGRKWELPSDMENLAGNIAHLLSVVNPEGWKEVQGKLNLDLPAEFDKLVRILVKYTADGVGKKFYIKLIGNNKGYATIPSLVRLSRDGNPFPANNWLSDSEGKLAFTTYEVGQMKKSQATKPTPMPEETLEDVPSKDDDLDLDDL